MTLQICVPKHFCSGWWGPSGWSSLHRPVSKDPKACLDSYFYSIYYPSSLSARFCIVQCYENIKCTVFAFFRCIGTCLINLSVKLCFDLKKASENVKKLIFEIIYIFSMSVGTWKVQKQWKLCPHNINLTASILSKNNYPNKPHTLKEYVTIIELFAHPGPNVPLYICTAFYRVAVIFWYKTTCHSTNDNVKIMHPKIMYVKIMVK